MCQIDPLAEQDWPNVGVINWKAMKAVASFGSVTLEITVLANRNSNFGVVIVMSSRSRIVTSGRSML